MKVFILLAEYVFDCEPTVEVDVFSSYEKAKEAFNECVKVEKENDHLLTLPVAKARGFLGHDRSLF